MIFVGVVLQVLALTIFLLKYRKSSFSLVSFYFLLAAFTYSGFSAISQILTTSTWVSGKYVSDQLIATWVTLISMGMLVYVAGYFSFDSVFIKKFEHKILTTQPRICVRLNPWVFIPAGLITLYLALSGSLWSPQILETSGWNISYFSIGLTRDLLWIAPSLAALSIMSKFGLQKYWLVTPLILILVALVGSRSLIIATSVILLVVGDWVGLQFGKIKILSTLVLGLVLVIALMQLRIDVGRAEIVNSNGIISRLSLVTKSIFDDALPSTVETSAPSGNKTQFSEPPVPVALDSPEPMGQRFDGNSIPAAIWTSYRNGTDLIGTRGFIDEMLLAVPQFMNPGKLNTPLESRHAKAAIATKFGLIPPRFPMDFLATQPGAAMAFWGPIGVLLFFIGFACLHAAVNFYRSRSRNIYAVLISTGFLVCALSYEQTLYIYGTVGRAILLLICVVWVSERLSRYRVNKTSKNEL